MRVFFFSLAVGLGKSVVMTYRRALIRGWTRSVPKIDFFFFDNRLPGLPFPPPAPWEIAEGKKKERKKRRLATNEHPRQVLRHNVARASCSPG